MNTHFNMAEGTAKKPFAKPLIELVKLNNADIICTSDFTDNSSIEDLEDGGDLF